MKEIECVISGKVQGVNFRSFVRSKANALWVTGFVENINSYDVRVVAQGSEEKLKKLIAFLYKGPFTAQVNNVVVSWRDPTEQYDDFSIHY